MCKHDFRFGVWGLTAGARAIVEADADPAAALDSQAFAYASFEERREAVAYLAHLARREQLKPRAREAFTAYGSALIEHWFRGAPEPVEAEFGMLHGWAIVDGQSFCRQDVFGFEPTYDFD